MCRQISPCMCVISLCRRICNQATVPICYGPLTRYVKLLVAHAPGMLGAFPPPLRVSDPDMHHGTCVTHVPWYMPGSLTSGFLWSRMRRKRSRHSQRMRNPQFYVSGKRPMLLHNSSPPKCRKHAGESLRFLASDLLRNGSWARGSVPGGSATVSLPLAI